MNEFSCWGCGKPAAGVCMGPHDKLDIERAIRGGHMELGVRPRQYEGTNLVRQAERKALYNARNREKRAQEDRARRALERAVRLRRAS